jgi:hypothetical protein
MLKYLRWSNFKISFDLNPFVWRFKYIGQPDGNPCAFYYLRLLMFSFLIVLDDGNIEWKNDGQIE